MSPFFPKKLFECMSNFKKGTLDTQKNCVFSRFHIHRPAPLYRGTTFDSVLMDHGGSFHACVIAVHVAGWRIFTNFHPSQN